MNPMFAVLTIIVAVVYLSAGYYAQTPSGRTKSTSV